MKRFLPGLLALVLALGGAWYYFSQTSHPGVTPASAQTATESASESGSESASESEADLSLVQDMSMGNPDAPVTVIEYASFTCPHCRSFHEGPLKQLKADYIDTDKINFVFREVYFDRYGLWAGMVARCGGEMRYFGIADLIFRQQSEWTQGEPAEVAENLRRIGKTAGLSDDQLDACLSDAEMAKAMVATWERNAEADEISSTPSFLINGEKHPNMPYDEFSALLDDELGE